MSNWKYLAGSAAVCALAAAIVQPAEAQLTSSNVSGRAIDASGGAIAGATVTITHEPSGQAKTAITSDNGTYYASGLRVGGPYTISVEGPAGAITRNGVFFQPGVGNAIELRATSDVIIVTAAAPTISLNNGVGSSYNSDDIISQPSIVRDLIATLNRDPLAASSGTGNLSVAGSNPRFNGLAIDGTLLQDDFGLSSSTYPTARSPINLDAIESASLVASDYSVTATGFTGGLVNVVTKSGTNEFRGSLFNYFRDEDFVGSTAFNSYVATAPFREKEYGATLGGPIIPDHLFFFLSYDKFETGSGVNFTSADATDGYNPALFDALNTLVLDELGYDMGGRPLTASLPEFTERYLAKFDWNISDQHRASFTYARTEESNTSVDNNSFTSAWYSAPARLDNYSASIFSDWTDALSTEFRISRKEFERVQTCNAGGGPEISIILNQDDLAGDPIFDGLITRPGDQVFTGGCDRFRHANSFSDERTQAYAAANYILGDHFFTVGGEWEDYSLFNVFAQRANGVFIFGQDSTGPTTVHNGLTDIRNGDGFILYRNATSNNSSDAAAAWGYNKLALFAQDQWQILPDLRIDYGLRYEQFVQDDAPPASTIFQNTYGFGSDSNLDGKSLIQPRVGFKYEPFADTTISGGFGLFAGGDPKVWTSNAFTPFTADAPTNLRYTGLNFPTLPQSVIDAVGNTDLSTLQPIDIIDPDFEIPSDWKASVKLEQVFDMNFGDSLRLGEGYRFTAQALLTRVNKGFRWQNLAQTDLPATSAIGVAPDGRPIYADLNALNIRNVTMLTNFDEGESVVWSVALQKRYDNGVNFFASYAHQDIESATEGGSSRGISNWLGTAATDRNFPELGRALYETEHTFKLQLGYEKEIFGKLNSEFRLSGQFTSGAPYSYMFDISNTNHLFGRAGQGENPFDNIPVYIPSRANGAFNDPNVVFRAAFNQAAFYDFAEEVGLPNGGIDPRYGRSSTWNQDWDFGFAQELPFPKFGLANSSLKFTLDIDNLGNLLNDEWGTRYNGPNFGQVPLITADLITAASAAANVETATALTGDAARISCTTQASCVYRFNSYTVRPTSIASQTASLYRVRMGFRFAF